MRELQRQDVQTLIDKGAQLVEVLGAEEYEEDHLPGAINISLRKIDEQAREKLDPNSPVIVYCWDSA
jgi:rhodanese-related sulfurtransferase